MPRQSFQSPVSCMPPAFQIRVKYRYKADVPNLLPTLTQKLSVLSSSHSEKVLTLNYHKLIFLQIQNLPTYCTLLVKAIVKLNQNIISNVSSYNCARQSTVVRVQQALFNLPMGMWTEGNMCHCTQLLCCCVVLTCDVYQSEISALGLWIYSKIQPSQAEDSQVKLPAWEALRSILAHVAEANVNQSALGQKLGWTHSLQCHQRLSQSSMYKSPVTDQCKRQLCHITRVIVYVITSPWFFTYNTYFDLWAELKLRAELQLWAVLEL